MKKIILLSTILISLGTSASADDVNQSLFTTNHPAGYSVQLSTNSLGLARYTQNHTYTYGFGISPYKSFKGTDPDNVNNSSIDAFEYSIFARRNFAIDNKTVLGVGLSAGSLIQNANTDYDSIKSSYNVSQYLYLEYMATEHIYIGAGLNIVNYVNKKYKTDYTATGLEFLGGTTLQLSYLF